MNCKLINLECIKYSYYHLWLVCVDLWSVIYFPFYPAFSFLFPSRHFQYTEVLLLLWNGYLSGWGCFICRRGCKMWVDVEDFSTGDKTPYRASGFLYHLASSIRRHGRHPKKNHIHFNHRNWQVAYSPFSLGLRVEFRGEISSRMQGFYSCREKARGRTQFEVLDERGRWSALLWKYCIIPSGQIVLASCLRHE